MLDAVEDSNSTEKIEDESNELDIEHTHPPLGQWVTMPRRSRRIDGQAIFEPFVETEPLQNHDTNDEIMRVTMLHEAMGNLDFNCIMLEPNPHNNSMLEEAVQVLKCRNDSRCLEN